MRERIDRGFDHQRSWKRNVMVAAAAVLATACTDAPATAPVRPLAPEAAVAADGSSNGVAATWTVHDLGVLARGTYSEAYGIGDNGWVVGAGDWLDPTPGSSCNAASAAFVFRNNQLVNLHLSMPDCTRYLSSAAFDVNASGTAVGWADSLSVDQAAIWDASGSFQVIARGCPGAIAHGINNAGTVVGWFNQCGSGAVHPFVWTAAGGFVDALPVGRTFGQAVDITDTDVIIGLLDGQPAMWRLGGSVTPIPGGVTTVGTLPRRTWALGGAGVGSAFGAVGGDGTQSWKYLGTFSSLPPFSPGAVVDASVKRRAVGWRTQPDVRALTLSQAGGGVTLLPGLTPANVAWATAVNRCGHVAGYAPIASGAHRAVGWRINACDP